MAEEKKPGTENTKETKTAEVTAKETNKPASKPAQVKKAPTVAKRSARKTGGEMNEPEVRIEEALSRTELFLQKNGKKMLTYLVIVLLIVTAILAYVYLVKGGRNEKAGADMFVAERAFIEESYLEALNGDGANAGFLEIIDRYGNTPQGNIARHYAGVSYLKLNDMDSALEYLAQYSPTKGSPNQIINAQNKGLQGDIYAQKGNLDRAIALYKEAIDASDNSFTAPMYLKKLGLVYDKLGRHAEAKAAFERIKTEYPSSMEGRDADKYIGREEVK